MEGLAAASSAESRDDSVANNKVALKRFLVLSAFSIAGLFFVGSGNIVSGATTADTEMKVATVESNESFNVASKTLAPSQSPTAKVKSAAASRTHKSTKAITNATSTSNMDTSCSILSQQLSKRRIRLAKNLPKNPQAHLFMFPKNLKDSGGFRNPVLCVPQKNGNKQFSALIYAIWKRRAPKSRVEVDHDFHRWAHHELRRRFAKHAHVYFVTRNPYTRMLSMYLQRVVSHCITDTKEHRCKPGWHNISAKTSFKAFLKIVEERVAKKGSLCKESHHLCQQVESCITTTSRAEKVTQIRLEEQSLWFPCLVKETGMYEKALTKGWSKFNGARSCYYTSTGECKDMLQNIDPNNVTIATGSVHATGASSPDLLRQYYDAEALDIVSRLYADDFRILGYPLWDEEALSLL